MSQFREDVLLEISTMLLSEQHDQILLHFHSHVLLLEDTFFSMEQQRQEIFDAACITLLPDVVSIPLVPGSVEGTEQQMQELLLAFETRCQNELAVLREEGDTVRQEMSLIIAVLEKRWETAERRRQNEFTELCLSCQKEVAAITAELRSGIFGYFRDNLRSAVLEDALHAKADEMRQVQRQLEEVTELRLVELTEHQRILQEEREKYQQRFTEMEQETSMFIEKLTADVEERDQRHLCDTREMQRQHSDELGALERQLCEEREANAVTQQNLVEELERYRTSVRHLEEEKTQLTQEMGELQTQLEEWRRRYTDRDTQAKMELIEHQRLAEALRLEESQEFRKQLVEAVRRGTSSPTIKTFAASQASKSSGESLAVTNFDGMQKHSVSADRVSVRMLRNREVLPASPTITGLSECAINPFNNWLPYTPTASYTKLMNISEQLRRHIEQN